MPERWECSAGVSEMRVIREIAPSEPMKEPPSVFYQYIILSRRIKCGDYEFEIMIGKAVGCIVIRETLLWREYKDKAEIMDERYYVYPSIEEEQKI